MGEKIDVLVCRAAVESGLITQAQLKECRGDPSHLVTRGYLSPQQISQLRTEVSGRLASSAAAVRSAGPNGPGDDTPQEVRDARAAGAQRIGKYQIVRELGRGGMGSVHKAWDATLKRWVALKILLGLGGEEEIARFRREAQTAATLSHPGIVGVYEIGMDGDRSFIAMEYIQGRTLAGEKPPLPRACEILIDVARAVDHAHRRGIIHRDLKPQNIMLEPGGQVRVMDFGLAKPLRGRSQVTIEGTVIGTPSYMSPEQADGRIAQIDHRSDVYSLGAVLYELLTGRPPFRGANVLETLTHVVEKQAPPPSKINPAVPKTLETIVMKALDKEKTRRYPSAEAFARDLERFLKGQAIAARPRPRTALWIAGAGALVAAVLIAALLPGRRVDEPAPPPVVAKKPAPPAAPRRDPRAEAQRPYDLGQRLYDDARLALYKQGADLSKMRDLMETAAGHFSEAIAVFPAYHEAFLGRGQARALQNRSLDALRDYSKAIEILPDYPAALLARGQLHLARYVTFMASAGWRREEAPPEVRKWRDLAVEDLTRARRAGLTGNDLEYCEASLALAEGKAQRAITLLSKLLEGAAKNEEHFKLRGDAHFVLSGDATGEERLDLPNRALRDFSEAIRLRPNYHEAYRHRGAVYFLAGKGDECLADLQAGLRMNPADSAALSDLGTYFQRTKRPDAALDYYARALQADPDNFRALSNRSSIRMAQKDYAAARADLEHALKVNPDHVAGIFNLAATRDAMGDTEEAIRLVSTVLARQPMFARGYWSRAVFRYKLGRWAEALDDLEKAVGIDPANYEAVCRPHLEDCRKRLGRK